MEESQIKYYIFIYTSDKYFYQVFPVRHIVVRHSINQTFSIKGVVHPQNDFLSSDYSCLGHLSSIVFFCICRISKIEKWF